MPVPRLFREMIECPAQNTGLYFIHSVMAKGRGLQTVLHDNAEETIGSASKTMGYAGTTIDSASDTMGNAKTTIDSASDTMGYAKTTIDSACDTMGNAKTTIDSASDTIGNYIYIKMSL